MGKTDIIRQAIVELRDYTNHPGTRETLVELFEREFFEPQETLGMSVIAAFRDIERPDRFVWLRGFEDMVSREHALRAFYEEHPAWQANRNAANATLIDSDNVLLLSPNVKLALGDARNATYVATICSFDRCVEAEFARGFRVEGTFTSAHNPNTYPRLPVREGEHTFVWLASSFDAQKHDDAWRAALEPFAQYVRGIDVRRLEPISISRLQ